MKNLMMIMLAFVFVTCSQVKYEDDIGFLNSAQANSMEFPVKIKKRICLDMENQPGLCSVRITSEEDFVMTIDPQEYSYRYTLTCSSQLGVDHSKDVPKNTKMDVVVPKEKIAGLLSFICIGEVFPSDREQSVSAKWEVRAKVKDAKYQGREDMFQVEYKGKNHLIFGKHARTGMICYGDKCESFFKKTSVPLKRNFEFTAYSESHNMRINYYEAR